ncbi:hypothetical protein [Microbacterium sp. 77mftsu3.1]|nr:hypothetical protein [Microbacterium sp. 77mftsu3.1]SDG22412.1 hypothetical protein SAMN04488590_0237 [Microbacterium sp. 77mftsu3.1]
MTAEADVYATYSWECPECGALYDGIELDPDGNVVRCECGTEVTLRTVT